MSNFRQKPQTVVSVRKPIMVAAVAMFSILLIWGGYLVGNSNKNNPTQQQVTTNDNIEDIPLKHGATGRSLADDQKSSLKQAEVILLEAGKSPRPNDTVQKRLIDLDTDDVSGVTPKLMSYMRFPDPATEGFKAQTYQSLITLNAVISENNTKEIKIVSDETYKKVYVDSQLGIAYVPLSSFTGNPSTAFNFEMVYVDGQWKLSPYSLLQAIKLSSMLTEEKASSKK